MDRDVTLYQITNVMAERVFQKIDNFNKGRREDAGYYAISVSTPYRSYYALWRIFPDNIYSPLFIQSLPVWSSPTFFRLKIVLTQSMLKQSVF